MYKARQQRGFTLIEVMIVVVVVAILAAIAYPSYQEQIKSARRADAQSTLMQAAQFMERFHTLHARYDKESSGAEVALPSHLAASPADGTAYYNIELHSVTTSSYVLRATPVAGSSQADDGFLQYTSQGIRGWDRANDGAIGAGENCWAKQC